MKLGKEIGVDEIELDYIIYRQQLHGGGLL